MKPHNAIDLLDRFAQSFARLDDLHCSHAESPPELMLAISTQITRVGDEAGAPGTGIPELESAIIVVDGNCGHQTRR